MIMKRQKGFSLVELVIVIVVIGLLATVALPRFLDVSLEAKKASVEGVAGGYATAVVWFVNDPGLFLQYLAAGPGLL